MKQMVIFAKGANRREGSSKIKIQTNTSDIRMNTTYQQILYTTRF